jgi:hypothetical protein
MGTTYLTRCAVFFVPFVAAPLTLTTTATSPAFTRRGLGRLPSHGGHWCSWHQREGRAAPTARTRRRSRPRPPPPAARATCSQPDRQPPVDNLSARPDE